MQKSNNNNDLKDNFKPLAAENNQILESIGDLSEILPGSENNNSKSEASADLQTMRQLQAINNIIDGTDNQAPS